MNTEEAMHMKIEVQIQHISTKRIVERKKASFICFIAFDQ